MAKTWPFQISGVVFRRHESSKFRDGRLETLFKFQELIGGHEYEYLDWDSPSEKDFWYSLNKYS